MNEQGDCNLAKSSQSLVCSLTGVAIIGLLTVTTVSPTAAQVIPDNSLGNTPSVVNTQDGQNILIEGGTRNYGNLFHSFQNFNVNNGQQVFFANPEGVSNIITRVTGNNSSNINGVLGVSGLANLFLINPQGIIFGADSKLDVKGSFIASTAESLNFSDGSFFSAVQPKSIPLLQVNVPIGLQYGANPAPIQVQQANLQVKPGKTLGLIGGNVSLDNATLTAPGGRVQLGGLLASGTLSLVGLQAFIPEGVKRGDVSLINQSSVSVIAGGSGDIIIDANNLSLNNSNFQAGIAANFGRKDAVAGDIYINTTENTTLEKQSNITNILEANSLGSGGKVTIKTNNFFIKDARIFTDTFSSGNAGNLIVQAANKAEIISSPVNFTLGGEGRKGLFSRVAPNATGTGGNITVNAKEVTLSGFGGIDSSTVGLGNGGKVAIESNNLSIIEGAAVLSNTNNLGNAGEIFIKTSDFIEINNKINDPLFANVPHPPGGIIADVRRGSRGNGGKINLETGRLTVRDGGFITTDTKGSGDGGDINIGARELVEVIGRENNSSSQLIAASRRSAQGKGGNLVIETKNLIVRDGGGVNVGTESSSNSGDLIVKATESIVLEGIVNDVPSLLLAQVATSANGEGGNILLETKKLTLADGAQISASNLGTGKGGNVNIQAADTIEITGFSLAITNSNIRDKLVADDTGNLFPSGIFSNSQGIGNAGNLAISTEKLTLSNRAKISVSNQQQGAAGNLQIQGEKIFLNNAIISAETAAGNQGSIFLNGTDIRLRQGSKITTNATQGATAGNININTDTLIAVENSDITANAEASFGGRVIINTQGIFGTKFREFLTPKSDITATSKLGLEFSGIVEVNTPDVDPTSGLVELPSTLTDSHNQIAAACSADAGNTFIVTGKGGLPTDPTEVLHPQVLIEDWRIPLHNTQQIIKQPQTINIPIPIVEIQGWKINEQGTIELVASLTQNMYSLSNNQTNCLKSKTTKITIGLLFDFLIKHKVGTDHLTNT